MQLKFVKEVEDVRGKIIFLSYGKTQINIVEIKQGFSRGGHYHPFPTNHTIMIGKLEYREKNLISNKERICIMDAPSTINVQAKIPHLLTAIQDSLFIEIFENGYSAIDYPEYRKIVEKKLVQHNK